MYQFETMTEAQARKIARRYIALIGLTMVLAITVSMTAVQFMGVGAQPTNETFRVISSSEDGVWRLNEMTGEVSVCTAENDGTLSCAVSHGLTPDENLPSTT